MTYNQLMRVLRDRAKLGACGSPQISVVQSDHKQTIVKITVPLTGEAPARPKSKYGTNDLYHTVYYTTNTGSSSTFYSSTTGGWY